MGGWAGVLEELEVLLLHLLVLILLLLEVILALLIRILLLLEVGLLKVVHLQCTGHAAGDQEGGVRRLLWARAAGGGGGVNRGLTKAVGLGTWVPRCGGPLPPSSSRRGLLLVLDDIGHEVPIHLLMLRRGLW